MLSDALNAVSASVVTDKRSVSVYWLFRKSSAHVSVEVVIKRLVREDHPKFEVHNG